jgi:aspartate kinase
MENNNIIVQKYGGTSVGSPNLIKNVAKRIIKTKENKAKVIVVVSAMAGETDRLINLAQQISQDPPTREMDMLLTTGEQVSISLLAMALYELGYEAISLNAHQVGIHTNEDFTQAKIKSIDTTTVKKYLDKNKIVLIAGFQGIDPDKNLTTLGRGGSDTSAVAIASAIRAVKCEIYTDVDGVYTADPRIIPDAKKISQISFDEMLELSSLGAKVLMVRSVIFAKKFNMPIEVKSSFSYSNGTLVTEETPMMEEIVVSAITQKTDEASITIYQIPADRKSLSYVFQIIADVNIYVNMIVQSSSQEGKTDISITILQKDIEKIKSLLDEKRELLKYSHYTIDKEISIVSVVGIGMRSHTGIASKVFKVLLENGIDIYMISTSEIKISVVVREDLSKKAIQILHDYFINNK